MVALSWKVSLSRRTVSLASAMGNPPRESMSSVGRARKHGGVSAGRSARARALDPVADQAADHVDGDGAVLEHDRMELLEIEAVAEPRLRLATQAVELELADHVAQRLPGGGEIAIDLALRLPLGQRGVLDEEAHGAGAIPAQRVQTGVDHQARGAPGLISEHSESRRRAGIEMQRLVAHL